MLDKIRVKAFDEPKEAIESTMPRHVAVNGSANLKKKITRGLPVWFRSAARGRVGFLGVEKIS